MIDKNRTKKKINLREYTMLSNEKVVVKFKDNANMKVPLNDGYKFDKYIRMLKEWIIE